MDKLKMAERIVACTCNLQLRLVNDSPEAIDGLVSDFARDELWYSGAAEAFHLRLSRLLPGVIYEIKSVYELRIAIVKNPVEAEYLVIGPCVPEDFSPKKAQQLSREYGLPAKTAAKITEYCQRLPQLSYSAFSELVSLLAAELFGLEEPIRREHIEQLDDVDLKRHLVLSDNYDELSKMRHIERRYEFSTAMTEAVKEGNLTLAYSFLRQMRPGTDEIVRSQNPLRNAQNMCIVANTQLRHALEEIGIHPYTLDKISSSIAMQIERLRTQKDANAYSLEIIRSYCELAQEAKLSRLKPFSRLAATYIKAHLSDNITVKSTAQALVVSPNYLSEKFHREVGMTFVEFVNRERVRQAAALLRHTNLPVQHIASSVGYNNSSYFAKQFDRVYGVSPRSYRNRSTRPDSGKALQR